MIPVIFFLNRHTPLHNQFKSSLIYSRMHQCHSNHVKIIHRPSYPQFIDNCDALITQDPNHLLLVKTADCLPILIYKPPSTIAAIHAGRKGTETNITKATIQKIQTLSPSKTEKWSIWFGPHICQKCYEINLKTHEKYDLKQKNIEQITKELPTKKISIDSSPNCTVCNNNNYFSYRHNPYYAGRFFSGIYLKKE
tara:strand:+ start:321 stop:905 length:585 start_codon:yes stop_codon:yes gene_type:complete